MGNEVRINPDPNAMRCSLAQVGDGFCLAFLACGSERNT